MFKNRRSGVLLVVLASLAALSSLAVLTPRGGDDKGLPRRLRLRMHLRQQETVTETDIHSSCTGSQPQQQQALLDVGAALPGAQGERGRRRSVIEGTHVSIQKLRAAGLARGGEEGQGMGPAQHGLKSTGNIAAAAAAVDGHSLDTVAAAWQEAYRHAAGQAAARQGGLPADVLPAVQGGSTLAGLMGKRDAGSEQLHHQQEASTAAATGVAAAAAAKPGRDMLSAMSSCWDFGCLRWAHGLGREAAGLFNFPHFMLIGWQKAATTSLYRHFQAHPQVITPRIRAPEFFSHQCGSWGGQCPLQRQGFYITSALMREAALASNLTKATFEASSHYAMLGPLMARGLASQLPWVRLVASLREPISRHLSMLTHDLVKRRADQRCRRARVVHSCLLGQHYIGGSNYTASLRQWLAAFPPDQLHFIQYESLVSPDSQAEVLAQLDIFLGLDPNLSPLTLELTNVKRHRVHPEGWPMRREEYQDLVNRVRPDAQQACGLMEQHGLIHSGAAWLAVWEAVWRHNLDACDARGNCLIQLT